MGFMDSVRSTLGRMFGATPAPKPTGNVNPAYQMLAKLLQGNAPGGWASDHRIEAQNFTGWTYVSLHAICKAAAGATVTVHDSPPPPIVRKTIRAFRKTSGSFSTTANQGDPLPPNHPLVKLYKKPNPKQSGSQFRYEQALMLGLHGICLVWNRKRDGVTFERYVIPTSITEPIRPSPAYPNGGYRIMPTNIGLRYDEDGYVCATGYWQALGKILPAEEVEVIKWPHPVYKDDGLGALAAGASWVDLSKMVDQSRWFHNKQAGFPSAIVTPPEDVDASSEELQAVEDLLNSKYGGPQNAGRIMVAGHGSVSVLGTTPREMAYEHGHDQVGAAVRALFATPGGAVGLFDQGTYGALAASFRGFAWLAVKPALDLIAAEDTICLAPQFGDGIEVAMTPPTIDDPDLIERQIGTDIAAGAITRGELRRLRGRQPFGDERDDMEAGSYGLSVQQMAMQQQAMQQQQQGGGLAQLLGAAGGPQSGQEGSGGPEGQGEDEDADGAKPGGKKGELATPDDRDAMPARKSWTGWDGSVRKAVGAVEAMQWTGVYLDLEPSQVVRAYQEHILDDDDVLAYEDQPHVTVRYGIAASPAELQRCVAGTGFIAFTVGTLDVFPGADKDVLILRVTGDSLFRLRRKIEGGILCSPDRHPDYNPHITIAYMKPGFAEKYLNTRVGIEGLSFAARSIALQSEDRMVDYDVSLGGVKSSTGMTTLSPPPLVKGGSGGCGPECGCRTCAQKRWLDLAVIEAVQKTAREAPRTTIEVISETPNKPVEPKRGKRASLMHFMPEPRRCDHGETEVQVYGVAKRALEAGAQGVVVRGAVLNDGRVLPHVWLEEGGMIHDPTRAQFAGHVDYAPKYEPRREMSLHDYVRGFEEVHGQDAIKLVWPSRNLTVRKTAEPNPPAVKTVVTHDAGTPYYHAAGIEGYGEAHKAVAGALGVKHEELASHLGGMPQLGKYHEFPRAKAMSHLLFQGGAIPNAVLRAKEMGGREQLLAKVVTSKMPDAVARAAKEYSDTPIHDLQVLKRLNFHHEHDDRRGLAQLGSGVMEVYPNSVTGDWRHELGHLIHGTLGAVSGHPELEDYVNKAWKEAVAKHKANPSTGKKLDTNDVQEMYGVPSLRGLDNDREYFAEHYRGYHRSIYQDKEAGGGTANLDLYRKRHPKMAAFWDAYYTTHMLAGAPNHPEQAVGDGKSISPSMMSQGWKPVTGKPAPQAEPGGKPQRPTFATSNVQQKAQNEAALDSLEKHHAAGDLALLTAAVVPPSPKIEQYKQELIAHLKANMPKQKPPTDSSELKRPVFMTSNVEAKQQNEAALDALEAAFKEGDIGKLIGVKITPSPKVIAYKQALVAKLKDAKGYFGRVAVKSKSANHAQEFEKFDKLSSDTSHDLNDAEKFLGTPHAGIAAMQAFSSGGFVDINSQPDHPVSRELTKYVAKLPTAKVDTIHRVVGFYTPEERDKFVSSLGKPGTVYKQDRTVTSWSKDDPVGQTPMTHIGLDVASQFGDHHVYLKMEQPMSAKDVSFIYGSSLDGKGHEYLLPRGHESTVHSVGKSGDAVVVTLKGRTPKLATRRKV